MDELGSTLIGIEAAQELLGVSRATLFNLAKRHQITRYHSPATGKRVFFRRAEIERLKAPQIKGVEDADLSRPDGGTTQRANESQESRSGPH